MKNIVIFMILFLTFTHLDAQDSKPTKQETMDWIGKTLLKYKNNRENSDYNSDTKYSDFSYANGLISYTVTFTQHDALAHLSNSSKGTYTIDLNKVLNSYSDYHYCYLQGQNIVKSYYTPNVKRWNPDLDYMDSYNLCISDCRDNEFIIVDENNIIERLKKAINALVEYNKNEQPTEAY